MKKLAVLILPAVLLAACGAPRKLNFNEPQFLDAQVPNSTTKEIKCGDSFSADFTNTDSTFATLEVDNTGKACNVNVIVTQSGGTPVTKFAAGPGVGNVAVFPLAQNQKYNFQFECESSTTAGACTFSYKLSTAREVRQSEKDKEVPKIKVSSVMPPGPTTGNMCLTQEQIAKVITNATKNEVGVLFTARSTCRCASFMVFGQPGTQRDQPANVGPGAKADGGVIVPAGTSVTLKAKCDDVGLTNVQCSGVIENIRLAIAKK